ncbi:protein kinase domain-containing protein [Gordonia sp. DT30]|uniref:protein kinase domain-containing protein n=1 Tax=unclassified Gordonia (in: high G+C Gram-positive bacteria) TaxID=2657482 RepID=UPI003CEE2D49
MAQLEQGSTFAGYQVLAKLGAGGMGQVYLVEHPHLLRREALKVISVTAADNAEFQQRFTNEARTVASLNHAGIVAIHHYGVEGDSPWFTMTYLDGSDLTAGGLTDAEVGQIALRTGEALDYAHRHQVIHRDIKPANIIVTREADGSIDQVVLLDFGIAKLADSTSMTATHAFIGTLAYAAPEVIDGQPAGPMSDQYALACSMYELLTGVAPFDAPTPSAMMAALLSKPAPPISSRRPDLAALDPVFERALAKDPTQRFGDCQSFARALAAVLTTSTGGPQSAIVPLATTAPLGGGQPPVDADARTVESRRRRSRLGAILVSAVAAIVVAVVAVAATWWTVGRSEPVPAAATAPTFTDVSVAVSAACTVRNRLAYCWGENDNGQLGDGTTTNRTAPVKVAGLTDVTAVSTGGSGTCAVAAGKAYCWGTLDKITTPKEIPGLSNVTDIATNSYTTCAIADSFLYCWGSNSEGQLGDGTNSARTAPTKIESLSSVTDVSVADEATCAIADSTAYCWGKNASGQLGDGTTTGRLTPVEVKNINYVSPISTGGLWGDGSTCARRADDSAYCWGDNGSGQIGDGTTTNRLLPKKILTDVDTIATNGGATCAITTARTLKCWGDNRKDYLDQPTPTDVRGVDDVTAVSVWSGNTCAIAHDQLYCWGSNFDGQVGDGTTDTRPAPTQVNFPT